MKNIILAYAEQASIIRHGAERYVVIGDLHIGRELKMARAGIRIYGTTEGMAERALGLLKKHKAKCLIIIGDVKDSITRADRPEQMLINSFFNKLSGYRIIIIKGNHDAALDLKGIETVKELVVGKVGLIHGNALPTEELTEQAYIISGHDHPAVMSAPYEDGGYLEKAFVVIPVNPKVAKKSYSKANKNLKLVLVPAFSDLITGNDIEGKRKPLNPLIRRGIFSLANAKVYNQKGEIVRKGIAIT